jgi:hypothetical protein
MTLSDYVTTLDALRPGALFRRVEGATTAMAKSGSFSYTANKIQCLDLENGRFVFVVRTAQVREITLDAIQSEQTNKPNESTTSTTDTKT